MCEIVGRVYPPLGACPEVWFLILGDSVGSEIPHLRVRIVLDILLHTKPGASRRIFSISHATELLEVGLNILFRMLASISWGQAVLATALLLGLDIIAVAHIGLFHLDQFFGEVVHSLVVVGGIGDFTRSESQPSDRVFDGDKVFSLFGIGIRVVESKNLRPISNSFVNNVGGEGAYSSAAVELGKAEVDSNCLCVTKLPVKVSNPMLSCDSQDSRIT